MAMQIWLRSWQLLSDAIGDLANLANDSRIDFNMDGSEGTSPSMNFSTWEK